MLSVYFHRDYQGYYDLFYHVLNPTVCKLILLCFGEYHDRIREPDTDNSVIGYEY